MVKFSLDSRAAEKMIKSALEAVSDFTEPLKLSRDYELNEIRKQFVTRGTNIYGARWSDRVKPVSWPILEKSGRLKNSFKEIRLTKDELQITSGIGYYPFHQKGTSRMVARPIIGFSDKMVNRIYEIFYNYLVKKIKNG